MIRPKTPGAKLLGVVLIRDEFSISFFACAALEHTFYNRNSCLNNLLALNTYFGVSHKTPFSEDSSFKNLHQASPEG